MLNFNPMLFLAQASEPPAIMQTIDRLARTKLSHLVIFIVALTLVRLVLMPKLMNTPAHLRSGSFGIFKFLNETADALVYAAGLVFLVIRPFVLQTFFVPSGSMLDSLQINDVLIGDKNIYRKSDPVAGDIVIFRPPMRALDPGDTDKYFIKRLVGAPGDVVEIREGMLYRNGALADEPYNSRGKAQWDFKLVKEEGDTVPVIIAEDGSVNAIPGLTRGEYYDPDPVVQERRFNAPPAPVPPGYYLFIGDNRNQSLDGRSWGLVPRREVIAKAVWRLAPFGRFGKVEAHRYSN